MSDQEIRPSSSRSIWLGFAETRPTGRGTRRIHLRWGRLAILAGVLMVCFWLTAATALYLFYREQKGYTEVAFSDMLVFPLKRNEIRVAHGNFNIEQAKKALDDGDYRAAYGLLMAGVRRAPANLEGRILLIRFFEAQGHHEGSRTLLEAGVPYAGEDLEFYRLYSQFLVQERDDQGLLDLADQVHATVDRESELARVMALFAMQAAGRMGKFERAHQLFVDYHLERNLEGATTAALLLEKRGQTEDAVEYLKQFIGAFRKESIGPAYRALTDLYLSSGQYENAISTALSYSLQDPLDFRPRILLIRAYEAAGKTDHARKEAQTVLRQFRSDADALTRLGLYSREVGDVELARRLYELALEGDIAVPRFGLIFLEAHLVHRDFALTIELCKQLEREDPEWLAVYRPEFAVMQALAYLGLGNQQLGNIYLNEFLSAPGVRNGVLLAVSKTFEDIGLPEYALQVLEEAYARDEGDETVLANLVKLQVSLGESRELTQRVERLLHLRRPDYDVFREVRRELTSDRFVFAENRVEVAGNISEVLEEVSATPLHFPTLREAVEAETPNENKPEA